MKELSFDESQFSFNQIKCVKVYVCECVRVGGGACLMSTEQQLFFPSENVQANPNTSPEEHPKPVPMRISGQSAATPNPGSHVAKMNGRQDSSQRKHSRDRTCRVPKTMTE